MDSHADTTVAGANCCILSYTGKECDVAPYREDYDSIPNIPIVTAATAWQSDFTGQVYIIVLNEALWMGNDMADTLVNPNQMRQFGTVVQDDPTSESPLHIRTSDASFSMPMQIRGTIVGTSTHTPTEQELQDCPRIELTSGNTWDPSKDMFTPAHRSLEDEIENIRGTRCISSVNRMDTASEYIGSHSLFDNDEDELVVFDIGDISKRIIRGVQVAETKIASTEGSLEKLKSERKTRTGTTDIHLPSSFVSSQQHTDVSPEELSNRWGIGIKTARKTLQLTT